MPESTPIRSLLNVKAATFRHTSKSPIQTAPAGRPATPRLPGFVEVFHFAPYSLAELELMTAGMQSPDYVWKTGELKVLQMPIEFPG